MDWWLRRSSWKKVIDTWTAHPNWVQSVTHLIKKWHLNSSFFSSCLKILREFQSPVQSGGYKLPHLSHFHFWCQTPAILTNSNVYKRCIAIVMTFRWRQKNARISNVRFPRQLRMFFLQERQCYGRILTLKFHKKYFFKILLSNLCGVGRKNNISISTQWNVFQWTYW